MYKQVVYILAALAALPASAFGQVTFSRDVAPVVFSKCAQCATQMVRLTKNRVMPPWKAHPSGEKFIGLDFL